MAAQKTAAWAKASQMVNPFLLSSSGTELPLVFESYGLLNDIFPFLSILDAGYPSFNIHLPNVLFDVILPSVLGSSL